MQLEFEFSRRELPCNRPKLMYQGAVEFMKGVTHRAFQCGACGYYNLYDEDTIADRCLNDRCRHIFQLENIILINNDMDNPMFIDSWRLK